MENDNLLLNENEELEADKPLDESVSDAPDTADVGTPDMPDPAEEESTALVLEAYNSDGADGDELSEEERLRRALFAAVTTGNNRLFQAISNQSLVINDDWVTVIEDSIHSFENIARNPKSFIREDHDLVIVEKARKVDNLSLRHLSSHSEFVKQINKDGSVIPTKVMTKHLEQDMAIYENRVVYTLIGRLKNFIEERYRKIKDLSKNKDNLKLEFNSNFKFGISDVAYSMNVSVKRPPENEKQFKVNEEILKRLENIKLRIAGVQGTAWARDMMSSKPVFPPLNKTNIFAKNVDYRNCFNLWTFIAGYDMVGYSIDVKEKKLPFDNDYFDDLSQVVVYSIETIIKNERMRKALYSGIDFKQVREKGFRVLKDSKIKLEKPAKMFDGGDINQYYFNKLKSLLKEDKGLSRAKDTEVADVSSSFRRIYKGLVMLNNEVFDELLGVNKRSGKSFKSPVARAQNDIKEQQKAIEKIKLLSKLKEDEYILAKGRVERAEAKLKKLEEAHEKAVEQELLKKEKEEALKAKAKERERLLKEREEQQKQRVIEREREKEKREQERQLALQKAAEERAAEREKLRLQREKLKEIEKEKAAKEREKQRLQREKQKAAEKERAAKEREKQRLKAQKEKIAAAEKLKKEKAAAAEKLKKEKAAAAEKAKREKEKEKQRLEFEKIKAKPTQPAVKKEVDQKTEDTP